MAIVAVVGGQWGDEGKGKIVDMLAERARVVVRYQGGNNAGHTVHNQRGEFALHLIPSGIFDPSTLCVIGNGVVVDPRTLLLEIAGLHGQGVEVANLRISSRAHVVMPYHVVLDCLEEQARGTHSIGTTGKGIGPCYVDKVGRRGIRMGDLLDERVLREKLAFLLPYKNDMIAKVYGAKPLDEDQVFEQVHRHGEQLAKHVVDTIPLLHEAADRGDNILLEGAQGTLLDLDFGTYPYVTSSSPTLGGACTGSGLSPRDITRSLGVMKAYSTRVGRGPFPTELTESTGEYLRERGQEFGTTTGRPRRCGWLDGVAARYAARVNGLNALAITRLDILDDLPSIRICTGYRLGPQLLTTMPDNPAVFEDVQPVYEEMAGWQRPTLGVRRFDQLPANAQRYVRRVSEVVNVPVDIVSVGPHREQTIILRDPFA